MRRQVLSRREFLAGSAVGTAGAAFGPCPALAQPAWQLPPQYQLTGPPLWRQAIFSGLVYGAATSYEAISGDPAFAAVMAKEAVMLTPSLELKWRTLRPSLSRFNFGPADAMATFARQHRMLLRGHTLVWNDRALAPGVLQQISSAPNVERLLTTHISTVVDRYAGRIYSWDVVNEALGVVPAPGRPYTLEPRVWLAHLGPTYIDTAFHAAREADRRALLVLNDYGFEVGLRFESPRRRQESMLSLLADLLARGVPVQAVGLEAHLGTVQMRERFNPQQYRTFLRHVAGLGLKILITELDVSDALEIGTIAERDRAVADTYARYLAVLLDEQAVITVNTWGLSDRHSWLLTSRNVRHRADQSPVRPLPLDANLNRKQAWGAMAYAFDHAATRKLWSRVGFPRRRLR